MASLTDEEEERVEPTPHITPSIEKIAKLVGKDGSIDKAVEKMDKARGDLGNIYQAIEKDFHGNRKAVKLIHTLRRGTTDAAYDFMRTFMHLADHFGLIPSDDLVDLANKNLSLAGSGGGSAQGGDDESGISSADVAPKSTGGNPVLAVVESSIDRHLKALKTGTKPPAPKGPPGDNDLADAGSEVADEIAAQRAKDATAFDATEGATQH